MMITTSLITLALALVGTYPNDSETYYYTNIVDTSNVSNLVNIYSSSVINNIYIVCDVFALIGQDTFNLRIYDTESMDLFSFNLNENSFNYDSTNEYYYSNQKKLCNYQQFISYCSTVNEVACEIEFGNNQIDYLSFNMRFEFNIDNNYITQFGYLSGYDTGYNNGYEIGFNDGTNGTSTLGQWSFDWLTQLFNSVNNIMNIEIIPNLKLWYIIGIPLAFSIVFMILKLFR